MCAYRFGFGLNKYLKKYRHLKWVLSIWNAHKLVKSNNFAPILFDVTVRLLSTVFYLALCFCCPFVGYLKHNYLYLIIVYFMLLSLFYFILLSLCSLSAFFKAFIFPLCLFVFVCLFFCLCVCFIFVCLFGYLVIYLFILLLSLYRLSNLIHCLIIVSFYFMRLSLCKLSKEFFYLFIWV